MIPLLNLLNKLGKPNIKKKIILFYTEDNASDLTSSVYINIGETVICPHSGKYSLPEKINLMKTAYFRDII